MNPFTQFLGRLVELVGAESAAQLTREFAGQTLQFPITDHYGFPVNASVLGAGYEPKPASHTTQSSQTEPHCLSTQASEPLGARLLALCHQLALQSQGLRRYADSLEQGRLAVLAEIELQQLELVGS
jgi:hypothetical protein